MPEEPNISNQVSHCCFRTTQKVKGYGHDIFNKNKQKKINSPVALKSIVKHENPTKPHL